MVLKPHTEISHKKSIFRPQLEGFEIKQHVDILARRPIRVVWKVNLQKSIEEPLGAKGKAGINCSTHARVEISP